MRHLLLFLSLTILLSIPAATAQQTRLIVEPIFLPFCTTVDARLHSVDGKLAPADEQKLDTARIQRAIDRCGRGRAVRLRVDEKNDAFLTGPLKMRPEVGLILGRGVTLFASRDARLYDRTPGSCGTAEEGCKPLISIRHASSVQIAGDGVLDGRGGESLLGTKTSWWDLAGKAQGPRLIESDSSNDVTVYRVTLRNAPSLALYFGNGDGLNVWGVHVESPRAGEEIVARGAGAKNVSVNESSAGPESGGQ